MWALIAPAAQIGALRAQRIEENRRELRNKKKEFMESPIGTSDDMSLLPGCGCL